MANVFDAQVKAVDAFSGPISRMVKGMRAIIDAAKGITQASSEGSKTAAKAAGESAHAIAKTAHQASKASTEAARESAHSAEEAVHHAEAAHLRYFRSMGAHVRLLHGHFGELNASIGEIGNSLKELLPAFGVLGAGVTLAGMFEVTKETAEAAIAMDAAAQQAGVTASQYAGLTFAAKESGLAGDTMTRSMERLNRTMGDSIAGKNKDAAALFQHLGINLKDAKGHTRAMMDVLPQLTEAFAATKDPTMQARMAFALFGRAGQELLPILLRGKEGITEMVDAGAKFADIGTDEERERLKEFGHTWGEMDAAAEGFKTRLATELAPALQPVIELARDWIMANRDWIATAMADKVRMLATWLRSLDLTKIIHQMEEWTQSIRSSVESHGGLKTVIGAVMLMLGSPLIVAIAAVGSAFLTLGTIIATTGSFMLANPIVAAVMAIGAAAMLIYKYWDPIKAFFIDLWAGITAAFDSAWAKIQPIVQSLKAAIGWVKDSWVGKGLAVAGHAVASVAQTVGDVVTGPTGSPEYAGAPGALYRPGGPALTAAQQRGEVRVKVDFANAPPGTRVTTDANGIARPPDTSVGYSNPLAFGGM